MTDSDLLAAHFALRDSRPDEDAFYQTYVEGAAVNSLRPMLVRILAWAASRLGRRGTVERTG